VLCPASDPSGHRGGPGSPYSKPSTAEDALPHPARPRRHAGRLTVSIAALYALCNARVGVLGVRTLTPRLLVWRTRTHAGSNRSRHVASQITMAAANGLQEKKRKHISFEGSTRTRLVGFLSATFRAVEFLGEKAPGRTVERGHCIPPGKIALAP
jgi:hypothetical protein